MNQPIFQGIKFAFLTALISGVANFLHKELLSGGLDPILLTAIKNSLAGLFFLVMLFFSFKQLVKIQRKDWSKFLLISLIGGSLPFVLFFKGLSLTSALNGSLIHKTLFLWVAVLAWWLLKEKFAKYQLWALGILLISTLFLVKFNLFSWGRGDLLIFLATLLWSFEVILVKKFIPAIGYQILATARVALGSVFILIFAFFSGKLSGVSALALTDWLKILTVSIVLFGYVYYWYRALSLAPANLVTSILTLAVPITIFLSGLKIWSFSLTQILGIALTFLGAYLLLKPLAKFKLWPQPSKN